MSQDYVSIANVALSKLGDDRISEPNEDSNAAATIKANWEHVRDATLRDHPWNCAMRRAELSARVLKPTETIFPYLYAFPMPTGWKRLVEILSPALAVTDWQFERGEILTTNPGPLFVRFVGELEEIGLWDGLFAAAFASRLAFQCCERITGSSGKKPGLWREYEADKKAAKGVDAKENPPTETWSESSWIDARGGGRRVPNLS